MSRSNTDRLTKTALLKASKARDAPKILLKTISRASPRAEISSDPATLPLRAQSDAGWPLPASFPAQRGYVDLGQGNGENNLRKAIVFGGYPNEFTVPSSLAAGDSIEGVPGNRANPSGTALAERSGQDIDQQSLTLDQYKASQLAGTANNRRIVTSLIDDPNLSSGTGANYTVKAIGFGNFLLYPSSYYTTGFPGGSGEYCAIYIGPASTSGTSAGGSDGSALYQVMLFR